MLTVKFVREDNGNCRVYCRAPNRALYCFQDEGSWGRVDFKFYRCSRDGEPSHEAGLPETIPVIHCPESATGREFMDWRNARYA